MPTDETTPENTSAVTPVEPSASSHPDEQRDTDAASVESDSATQDAREDLDRTAPIPVVPSSISPAESAEPVDTEVGAARVESTEVGDTEVGDTEVVDTGKAEVDNAAEQHAVSDQDESARDPQSADVPLPAAVSAPDPADEEASTESATAPDGTDAAREVNGDDDQTEAFAAVQAAAVGDVRRTSIRDARGDLDQADIDTADSGAGDSNEAEFQHEDSTVELPAAGIATAGAPGDAAPDHRTEGGDGTAVLEPVSAEKKRGRKPLWITVAVVVVLAAAYVGAALYFSDRVPASASVAGVDISGQTRDQAVATLNENLAPIAHDPLPVALAETEGTLDPVAAGLSFDADATVDPLVKFNLDPRILWGHISGLGEVEPAVAVDEDALRVELGRVSETLAVPPQDGSIAIEGTEAVVTDPVNGTEVDVDEALELVQDSWLTAARPLVLPAAETEPAITSDVVEATLTDHIEPLLAEPITLTYGEQSATLEIAETAGLIQIEPGEGSLTVTLDSEQLHTIVADKVPGIEEEPQDARILLQDGSPTIEPHVPGRDLDAQALSTAIIETITPDGDERSVELSLAETEPEFTTAAAEELGVLEEVSYFSTPMPYDPVRTTNLVVGTGKLNGMLIEPGETFSLIEALSPITLANGYTSSGMVVDGFSVEGIGGGLSQLSTTMFNAAFEAGMTDVTHRPHTRWFDRYPAGREATMAVPGLDMQWRNNTPYGVLIQAWVADSRTHVRLWSTEYWDVEITTGARTNFTNPTTRYNPSPECISESGGQQGFTITYSRTVSRDGVVNEDDSRSYRHTYSPWNRIVCGTEPSADSSGGSE